MKSTCVGRFIRKCPDFREILLHVHGVGALHILSCISQYRDSALKEKDWSFLGWDNTCSRECLAHPVTELTYHTSSLRPTGLSSSSHKVDKWQELLGMLARCPEPTLLLHQLKYRYPSSPERERERDGEML